MEHPVNTSETIRLEREAAEGLDPEVSAEVAEYLERVRARLARHEAEAAFALDHEAIEYEAAGRARMAGEQLPRFVPIAGGAPEAEAQE